MPCPLYEAQDTYGYCCESDAASYDQAGNLDFSICYIPAEWIVSFYPPATEW